MATSFKRPSFRFIVWGCVALAGAIVAAWNWQVTVTAIALSLVVASVGYLPCFAFGLFKYRSLYSAHCFAWRAWKSIFDQVLSQS